MDEGSTQYTHTLISVNSPVRVCAYQFNRCDSPQVFMSEVV